jgi:alpha-L-rhamnosidase
VDALEVYPVKCVGEDAATQGNWGGRYGADGYVLPNYDGPGRDVRALPSYVASVVCDPERCANTIWTTNTTDLRAPARGPSNAGTRSAACIYTKDPTPTYQTMFVDITLKASREYTLALYFVDWDSTNRRVGVQMVDQQTLKQLAPVKVVRDYHAGKYLLHRCDRSVRVRIDTIKKPNATLSGIFFSPAGR